MSAESIPGSLPDGAVAYRRTPIFDEHTIPSALRHEHRTKPDVWGVITVLQGKLRYRSLDPAFERILTDATPMVVAPGQPHEVEPDGRVHFFVEFYRLGGEHVG
jgi:tellurite resistance-related uncharacterized protein